MLKSINSTIKEKVKIKQHIRVEGGKVSNVKQHMALREVNPDKGIKKENTNKNPSIMNSIDEYTNAMKKLNPETASVNDFLSIYKIGINSIYDSGLEKNGQNLEELIKGFSNTIGKSNPVKSALSYDVIKKKLLSPEFIEKISKRIDIIEKQFNDFDIDTERINPFSFRFKHGGGIEYRTDDEKFSSSIIDIMKKNGLGSNDKYNESIKRTIKNNLVPNMDFYLNAKELDQNVISKISTGIFNSVSSMYKDELLSANMCKKVSRLFEDFRMSVDLKEYLSNVETNKITDGEIIRKKIKELFSANPYIKEFPDVLKTIKQLKPTQVRDWATIAGEKFLSFTPEAMNKLYDPIANIVKKNIDRKKQVSNVASDSHETYIYVTKNPFEFLTMSPAGNFESCQSVCTSDGESSVTNRNLNILSGLCSDDNNDFLMNIIKQTKNGLEKSARTSFNYNTKDKSFRNFEGGKVYGNGNSMGILRGFLDTHSNSFKDGNTSEISSFITKLSEVPVTMIEKIISDKGIEVNYDKIAEEGDRVGGMNEEQYNKFIGKVNNIIKNFQDLLTSDNYKETSSKVVKEMKSTIYNQVTNGNNSMLYSGHIDSLLFGGNGFVMGLGETSILNDIDKSFDNAVKVNIRDYTSIKKDAERNQSRSQRKSKNNTNFKLSINSTIKKKVRVKQHLRSEHGKVSTVKQYLREQDINPDKNHIYSNFCEKFPNQKEEYNSILKKINKAIDWIDPEQIKNLYTIGKNAVNDYVLESDKQPFDRLYNKFSERLNSPTRYYNVAQYFNLNDFFGQDIVSKRITSPEYLYNVEKRVDNIETFFNDELGEKTERLTPFMFRFEHGIDIDYYVPTDFISNNMNKILNEKNNLFTENKMNSTSYLLLIRSILQRTSRLTGDLNKLIKTEPQKIDEYIKRYPMELFNNIVSFSKDKLIHKFNLKEPTNSLVKEGENLKQSIDENKDFWSTDKFDIGDDEAIRKKINKEFPQLKKLVKTLGPQHIKSFIHNLTNQNIILTREVFDSILPSLQKMSNDIKSKFMSFHKDNDHKYIYVSKNPMELLTMSPTHLFTSCQSLMDKNGNSTVSSLNANMISAAYGDHNNDFILFTTRNPKNDNMEKTARISYSLNEKNDTLETYESSRVFNNDLCDKGLLNEQAYKNMNHISEGDSNTQYMTKEVERETNIDINKEFNLITDKINDIDGNIQKSIENYDKRGCEKYIDVLENMRNDFMENNGEKTFINIMKNISNKQKGLFNSILTTSEKSMLYDSAIHTFVSYTAGGIHSTNGLDNIVDNVVNRINELAKYMGDKISYAKKLIHKEKKSINSTIKEKVKIKQHVRIEGGKVSNVKQHMALREVNPDKGFENIHTSLDDFIKKISNIDLKIATPNDIVSIYQDTIHAIHDHQMEENNQPYDKRYDELVNTFIGSNNDRNVYKGLQKDLFSQNTVKNRFTSKDYIKNVSDRVDKIEDVFNNMLNIKTERIDPFTFRFEENENSKFNINKTYVKTTIKQTLHKLGLSDSFKLKEPLENFIDTCISSQDYKLNSETNLDKKDFIQRYMPSEIMEGISNFYLHDIVDKFNFQHLSYDCLDSVYKFLRSKSDIWGSADSEYIRKEFRNMLNDNNEFKQHPQLFKTIKTIKPQQVKPFISGILTRTIIPDADFVDKIYTPLNKMADNIVNKDMRNIDIKNRYVYISKNPFELLTMSPTGNFESCQSLMSGGIGSISSYNANMISAAYGDHNHDFIMFTTKNTKNGLEKSARVSLQYNPEQEKMESFEHGKVYKSVNEDEKIITNFLYKNRMNVKYQDSNDCFDEAEQMNKKLNKESLNDAFAGINKQIDSALTDIQIGIKNKDEKIFQSATKDLDNISNMIKSQCLSDLENRMRIVNKAQKRNFINELNTGISLLYNCPAHKTLQIKSLTTNFHEIIGGKMFDTIDHIDTIKKAANDIFYNKE